MRGVGVVVALWALAVFGVEMAVRAATEPGSAPNFKKCIVDVAVWRTVILAVTVITCGK